MLAGGASGLVGELLRGRLRLRWLGKLFATLQILRMHAKQARQNDSTRWGHDQCTRVGQAPDHVLLFEPMAQGGAEPTCQMRPALGPVLAKSNERTS